MKRKENKTAKADGIIRKALGVATLIAGSATLLCLGGFLGLAAFFVSFALFFKAWETELDDLYDENDKFFERIRKEVGND